MALNLLMRWKGEEFIFASLDGLHWLGVNRRVEDPEGEAWLKETLEVGVEREVDGKTHRFLPMTFATRYLRQLDQHDPETEIEWPALAEWPVEMAEAFRG